MLNGLAVAVFGALGALARWGVNAWVQPATNGGLPWGTLVVNGVGSLGLGLLTGWCLGLEGLDPRWRLALGTGLLGSFTTFSTFSVETIQLAESGRWGLAATNVALQLAVGLSAAAAGFFIARNALA
jgi:CrcB protein